MKTPSLFLKLYCQLTLVGCATVCLGQDGVKGYHETIVDFVQAVALHDTLEVNTFIKEAQLPKTLRRPMRYHSFLFLSDSLPHDFSFKNVDLKNKGAAILHLLNGMKWHALQEEDSLAFDYGTKALYKAKNFGEHRLVAYVFQRLGEQLLNNPERTEDVASNFLADYSKGIFNQEHQFWLSYFKSLFVFQKANGTTDSVLKRTIKDYKGLQDNLPDNDFIKGRYFQSLGIVHANFLQDTPGAIIQYKKAIEQYQKVPSGIAEQAIVSCGFNIAVEHFQLKNYVRAIHRLRKLGNAPAIYKVPYVRRARLSWLSKAYDSLRQKDSALFFLKAANMEEKRQQQIKKALAMKKIDKEYRLHDVQQSLSTIQVQNEVLGIRMQLLIFILLMLLAVSFIAFWLYRRYFSKSRSLIEEQSETLQRLDELKQLVIKNHIVLKDKTKIYISDLMYIKAEDHYLKLFLNTGKQHLVRGKLREIKQELPPNFVQSHRSYIVNSNFIKQVTNKVVILLNGDDIPISKTFKNGLS
ncbi:TPR repeat-containing protein [Croceitalea dokdonensis DOKDO 023]|uniref:TPR repeat-containing protein n=1 Tax=Croceitalea dokdonensis DOKDO 023 TaxID=1300341 RepID=A0A0P7A5U7_9FLAO|nr:LytTR family DNA-binding domain-containing protein [Croceitalea dokdonensis]KPM31982.1 TPR repeat-containing protein [Croceitalea dokdonensis DOKDO 023]